MSALDKEFVFVIGAPRSGTTWLHHMLAEHPSVAAMSGEELTVFSRYLAPWATNFQLEKRNRDEGRWAQGLPCLYTEPEFEQRMLTFVEDVYSRVLLRRADATHILDKHPNYSNHLPLIDRLLPKSRFIHIIRDGREVAVSMMSVNKRVGHSPAHVRESAREWHRCVTNARVDGARLGSARYTEIRYEDLKDRTSERFSELLKFCGLATDDGFAARIAKEHDIQVRQVSRGDSGLNALRAQPDRIWKERMSTEQRWIFDRMAGRSLRDLGYAQHGWWATGAGDRLRMLPYGLASRTIRTLKSLRSIWGSPVEEQLK